MSTSFRFCSKIILLEASRQLHGNRWLYDNRVIGDVSSISEAIIPRCEWHVSRDFDNSHANELDVQLVTYLQNLQAQYQRFCRRSLCTIMSHKFCGKFCYCYGFNLFYRCKHINLGVKKSLVWYWIQTLTQLSGKDKFNIRIHKRTIEKFQTRNLRFFFLEIHTFMERIQIFIIFNCLLLTRKSILNHRWTCPFSLLPMKLRNA